MRYSSIPKWQRDEMKFSDLVTGFLRHRASKGAAKQTCTNYQLACEQFLGFLFSGYAPSSGAGNLDDSVKNFNPETVEAWVQRFRDDGLQGSSISVKLSSLSALGEYGIKTKGPNGK